MDEVMRFRAMMFSSSTAYVADEAAPEYAVGILFFRRPCNAPLPSLVEPATTGMKYDVLRTYSCVIHARVILINVRLLHGFLIFHRPTDLPTLHQLYRQIWVPLCALVATPQSC